MKTPIRVVVPAALSLVAVLVVLSLHKASSGPSPATNTVDAPALPPPSNGAISPQDQADALHFVIAADREIYFQLYISRPAGDTPSANASPGGKPSEPWPSPCEMLRRAAGLIQGKGAEFSYALRSLHSIDPRNEPQTELERRGLDFLNSHPAQNYYGQEMLGGRRYFTAVYPDIPAAAACIECHNRRGASAPQRYQVGEVMGGTVVRVPLEF